MLSKNKVRKAVAELSMRYSLLKILTKSHSPEILALGTMFDLAQSYLNGELVEKK